MSKKFLKRILPAPGQIQSNKHLSRFGELLHDGNLWHLNRNSVARATAIGLFTAFMPMPFQMILATTFAIRFRANLALSISLVWLSNPVTMPAMFYFAYKLGAWVLLLPSPNLPLQFSWHAIINELQEIWRPLLIGTFLCGVISSVLGYVTVQFLWRYLVMRRWRYRHRV